MGKLLILLGLTVPILWAQPAEREPSIDPHHYQRAINPCYDENGAAQRCVPDFINAAFNLEVEVTNVCGETAPTKFCVQTGHMGLKRDCDECDARVPEKAHPSSALTDFNNPEKPTWWQSDTMHQGIQYPHSVNLTLTLEKAYDITYVRLKFVSPRPESFVIYKKTNSSSPWEPWQYYSLSCRSTFKLVEKAPILPGNEAVAQCTRDFSDIIPITGGDVPFSTLDGRPSAENFEESEILQEWVTAMEIRIQLLRLNTYGDEIFRDPRVLSSYYYAISDFAVGGRCKCNGHANECKRATGDGVEQMVCNCQHHTAGRDCERCEAGYVARPWRAATSTEANECLPCNCSNLSTRCFFDNKLYEETGNGGHCIDCAGNTQGPHCEECVPDHWRRPGEQYCTACMCNEMGSEDSQCDANGQCKCKPGVGGQFCDHCENGFYDFSSSGCKDCGCSKPGSKQNIPRCFVDGGQCECKQNVEGQKCDKCKPGYFDLSLSNEYGCSPCFCFGHSSVCSSVGGTYATNISSPFYSDVEHWTSATDVQPIDVQFAAIDKAAAVFQPENLPVYFLAPKKFLGDQKFSYNQDLVFTYRLQANSGTFPSNRDVILVGANGQELSIPINGQMNPIPTKTEQTYRFHLSSQAQWSPHLREVDFISVLSNLTALKIRATYSPEDVGFLSEFTLGSASLEYPDGTEPQTADWVETCQCSEGFVGQFCESCAPGYKRALKYGGSLAKCIKCECNGHSESCDAESGECHCQHNTAGDTCERCSRGYYGDALNGTEYDCRKCDCPENGPCMLLNDGDTICTECPDGYTGRKCDTCAEEYFGNPTDGGVCKKCECNGNTDSNSIGNCDTLTGECKKCIFHTTGFNCERCTPGYWGDALSEAKGDCKQCGCYAPGTVRPTADYERLECRQSDGQCECQPNVIGRDCDQCETNYFNLTSGVGCEYCDCDPMGSVNTTCDVVTGHCTCKPGVTGRKCDQCAPFHFGFSNDGCRPCECDSHGSENSECDVNTGQCLCKDNVEGRQCDQCSENRYELRSGCLACDACYSLIQHRKNTINSTISKFRENLDDIQSHPVTVEDAEFDSNVQAVGQSVESLQIRAQEKLKTGDNKMTGQVNEVKNAIIDVRKDLRQIDKEMSALEDKSAYVKLEIERVNSDKDSIDRELNHAIEHTKREGQAQLANAQNAANRFGDKSQQLSEMADVARQYVDSQEKRKTETEDFANKAAETSKKAFNEANEAIYGATSTSQQIQNLKERIDRGLESLQKTGEIAAQEIDDANAAYDGAARTLSNVESAKFAYIVPDEVKENAEHQKQESSLSLTDAKGKIEENRKALEEAQTTFSEAATDLRNARSQQQEAESVLKQMEGARERAKSAFDLATKTWNDAQGSFDALSDFNNNVDANKQEALEQLDKLTDIQQQINEAQKTTAEAEADIGNAKANANQASAMATKAQEDAKKVAEQASLLKNQTTATKTEAESHKTALDKLFETINSLDDTTSDFDNQAQTDSEKSTEILRKAIVSDTSAKNLQNRLNESEVQLNHALALLNSLEDVNDEQLEELENLLNEAERQYAEAAMDKLFKEEITRKAEKDKTQLKREVDSLNKQLENLRTIYESLPERCFNLVNLEQEGQK